MAGFDITRPQEVTALDGQRRGQIPFSVTNLSSAAVRARIEVVPDQATDRDLLRLEGEAERTLRPNETMNGRVLVGAGATTSPGPHVFRLKVVDVERPDDHHAESQPCTFVVPPPQMDGGGSRKWWLLAAAVVVTGIAGYAGWYLYMHPKVPDYRGPEPPAWKVDAAARDLGERGFIAQTTPVALVREDTDDKTVVSQSTLPTVTEKGSRRARRGSTIELGHAVKVVPVTGIPKEKALAILDATGIKVNMITVESRKTRIRGEFGLVLAQAPDPANREVPFAGDHLVLTIGVPFDPVPVPSVIGEQYCTAVPMLNAQGFSVRGIRSPWPPSTPGRPMPPGSVVEQDVMTPAVRTPGETVTLRYMSNFDLLCAHRLHAVEDLRDKAVREILSGRGRQE